MHMLKLDAKLAELGLQPGSVFKDSFIFYRSFADTLRNLPDKYKIALLDALMDFGLDMREPDFSGDALLTAIWTAISPQLEANWVRTLDGKQGGLLGIKGGAPKGNKNACKDKAESDNDTQTKRNDNQAVRLVLAKNSRK